MFYDPSDFSFIERFEQKWRSIRDEYQHLDAPILDVHRNGTHEDFLREVLKGKNGWAPSWQILSTEMNCNWLTYFLFYKGCFPEEASRKFPVTMALLKETPGIIACAFSKILPASHIGLHVHPELGGDLLTFHLGLELEPHKSYLCVNDMYEDEAEGKSIVFDGSLEHFAINTSTTTRTILYVEFDRSKLGTETLANAEQ